MHAPIEEFWNFLQFGRTESVQFGDDIETQQGSWQIMNSFSMKKLVGALLVAMTVMLFGSNARASVIPDLFNTGVDASGVALVGGNGVIDPHYTISSSTIGATVGANAVTYLNAAYIANSPTSRWVSNSSTGAPGSGFVTFKTTFDLTGVDPNASVSISGLWGVDNVGKIFLNGNFTGDFIPFGYPAFQSLQAFTITSGFIIGINTLEFEVEDLGGPLAFRVEGISGTVVPEPSTIALIAMAFLSLLGFGMMRRRADA